MVTGNFSLPGFNVKPQPLLIVDQALGIDGIIVLSDVSLVRMKIFDPAGGEIFKFINLHTDLFGSLFQDGVCVRPGFIEEDAGGFIDHETCHEDKKQDNRKT